MISVTDAGNIAIWLAAIAELVFVIRYTMIAPWWRNPVGSTIVALGICLLVILVPTCIELALPTVEFFRSVTWQWVTVTDLLIVPAVAIWRLLYWERVYRLRKQIEKEKSTE